MADEEFGMRDNNMKFYRSVSNVDNFDTLSNDSNDDGLQLDPDFIEDRFRVDRKKLEVMLQFQCQNEDETAEEFFQRVMDESNTQITWPSKLKIGAKSKKDPHIKVIGRPEDVKAAKEQIMSVLDTKSNRVTLKMDVSHTEHSHVIGKGGNNIKRVMQETACHIHFPDSNRGNNVQEKSNQVSIAGQPIGVESARVHIRDLLPLVFMFELPTNGSLTAPLDSTSPTIQHIQTTYKVTVSFRQRPKVYTMTVIVRGSVCNSKAVKEATMALVEHLTGSIGTSVQVSLQLEIATQHHLFMIGRAGMNIKQIMQRTGATIHFPDPSTVTPQRKGTVYVTGSMDSVIHARHQLIGCLPLVLMFDVKDSVEIDQGKVTLLMEQLDVFISVKPKPKQTSKSVIVKSIERNSVNMYVARLHLLGLANFRHTITPIDNRHINNLTPLNYIGQNIVSMNAANTLMMMSGHTPTPHIMGPTPSTAPAHWVQPPPGLYSPVVVMTSPGQYSLTNPLDMLIHNTTISPGPPPVTVHLNNNNNNNNNNNVNVKHTAVVHVPSPSNTSSCNSTSSTSPQHSSCSSPTQDILPNNSLGINEQHHQPLHQQLHQQTYKQPDFAPLINHKTSPSSSGHTLDLLGLSKPTGSPPTDLSPPLFMAHPLHRNNLQSDDLSPEAVLESLSHLDSPSLLERNDSNASLFSSHGTFAFDYERKKLLATKAIQKKPEGESRIPTDFWSGLGFSKSMPDSVIRDAFANSQLKLTTLGTPLQCNGTDVTDDDIDRDPWKNSTNLTGVKAPINPAPGEYPSPRKKMTECRLSTSSYIDSLMLPTKRSNFTSKSSDLAELFSKMGLGKYTDLFQQQEIDLSTFLTLTDYDLKELGITTFGARRKMLLAIADINKRGSLFSLTPGSNNPYREAPTLSPHLSTQPDMGGIDGRW